MTSMMQQGSMVSPFVLITSNANSGELSHGSWPQDDSRCGEPADYDSDIGDLDASNFGDELNHDELTGDELTGDELTDDELTDDELTDDELSDAEASALDRFERELLSDADWGLDDSPEPELGDFWFDTADEWD